MMPLISEVYRAGAFVPLSLVPVGLRLVAVLADPARGNSGSRWFPHHAALDLHAVLGLKGPIENIGIQIDVTGPFDCPRAGIHPDLLEDVAVG